MTKELLFDKERVQELVEIIGVAGYERLLNILWNDLPKYLDGLLHNQEQNDLAGVSRMIHTLRGSLSNLGFGILGNLLADKIIDGEKIENFRNYSTVAYNEVIKYIKQ
ncbi:MAG: Hpt domain-containing protein [Holosporales bacterium]|jgi:hypothetical protein